MASTNSDDMTIALPHAEVHARGRALDVSLIVPGYDGDARFTLSVEPDADGDWRVFLPDTDQYDVSGNIVYIGAPDEPVIDPNTAVLAGLRDMASREIEMLDELRPEIEMLNQDALRPEMQSPEETALLTTAFGRIRALRLADRRASVLPPGPDVLAFRAELRELTAWLADQDLPGLGALPTNELES